MYASADKFGILFYSDLFNLQFKVGTLCGKLDEVNDSGF